MLFDYNLGNTILKINEPIYNKQQNRSRIINTINTPKGGLKPSKRENVSSKIMDMLVDLLLNRKLLPGDKLPTEPELASILGVGRNSVREALKMLGSFGVIEIKRGVGTFISKSLNPSAFNPLILSLIYNQEQQKEFLELRYFFEVAAVDLAINRMEDKTIAKLDSINQKIHKEAIQLEIDNSKVRALDFDFHNALLAATNNPFFIRLGEAMYKLFYSSIGSIKFDQAIDTYKNHEMIIKSIKEKDVESLRKTIWDSLIFWSEYVGDSNNEPQKQTSE